MLSKKQTVCLKNNCMISIKLLIILLILLIVTFLSLYTINKDSIDLDTLIIVLSLIILIIVAIYDNRKHANGTLEKITVTNNDVIITAYLRNKKQNFIFDKAKIKNFIVKLDNASCRYTIMVNSHYRYIIQIIMTCYDSEYYYKSSYVSNKTIKSIFKLAKHIPNFSYEIVPDCISFHTTEINKIAKTGKNLNIIDIFSNSNISKFEKREVIKTIILAVLGGLFGLLLLILIELSKHL